MRQRKGQQLLDEVSVVVAGVAERVAGGNLLNVLCLLRKSITTFFVLNKEAFEKLYCETFFNTVARLFPASTNVPRTSSPMSEESFHHLRK